MHGVCVWTGAWGAGIEGGWLGVHILMIVPNRVILTLKYERRSGFAKVSHNDSMTCTGGIQWSDSMAVT